jgi:hypothetical protein
MPWRKYKKRAFGGKRILVGGLLQGLSDRDEATQGSSCATQLVLTDILRLAMAGAFDYILIAVRRQCFVMQKTPQRLWRVYLCPAIQNGRQ